jgi:hypothetical protein
MVKTAAANDNLSRRIFTRGSLGSRVRKATCGDARKKVSEVRTKKSKQEKPWKTAIFARACSFEGDFPSWQCSCFVLAWALCVAQDPKVA